VSAVTLVLPHLCLVIMIAGHLSGRPWATLTLSALQLLVPLLDVLLGVDTADRAPSERRQRLGLAAVWAFVPLHVLLVWSGLEAVARATAGAAGSPRLVWPAAVAVGAAAGMFAVPVAHELMHRPGRLGRIVAEAQMSLLSYPHFCIEHVQGHHRWVGTPRDPATARLGESVFAFYRRTVAGGLASAWRLEAARLQALGSGWWSARNRLLRYGGVLAAAYGAVHARYGWEGVAFFAIQGVVGFSTLEVINYIEHYGLTRRETGPGTYERVGPQHAWNSSHRLSNWLLWNVARHSDHHREAHRDFTSLRNVEDAPRLPGGYFSMFVLALVPPLWRRVMDPLVEGWRRTRPAM
jgi:alkane 1-monooxygenase